MSKGRESSATSRLKRDYLRLKRDPVPYVTAEPLPSNILEWHYVVRGPGQSPYEGGYYHGKLVFAKDFPFRPPAIYMLTPNGRFKTNIRLCLSISDFHPDTWNPAWSVSTILTGLLSFMLEETPTMGSIDTSDCSKRLLATESLQTNLKDRTFCELFPDTVQEIKNELKLREEAAIAGNNNGNTGNNPLNSFQTQDQSMQPTLLINMCVLLGFVAFAYIVQCVLGSV